MLMFTIKWYRGERRERKKEKENDDEREREVEAVTVFSFRRRPFLFDLYQILEGMSTYTYYTMTNREEKEKNR